LRVTSEHFPLPPIDSDSPEETVWTDDMTAVSMVAVTAANEILLPAQPVTEITEDQADLVAATVDTTLAATPQASVEAMVDQGGAALSALETTTLRPTNQAIYDAVAPIVYRHAAIKIPNPFTYGPERARIMAGLSEEEFRVCSRHFYDCARNYKSDKDANAHTKARYGRSGHNDISDAFRHCMWSALMTKRANAHFAELLGIAHEAANIRINKQPSRETWMDLHNNSRGRLAGQPDAKDSRLSTRCHDRQTLRDLVWLVGPGRTY
jgi:hypothetical protein